MVKIVGMGEREVIAVEVNGRHLDPEEVKRINSPEGENPNWEIELKDGTILVATGSVTMQYKTGA
jgi:hypothetical protein